MILNLAYRPGLDTIIAKWSCMNQVHDTIPQTIQIQASGCSSWDIYVNSGEYVAIGSADNHQVYKRATNDANGWRWYFVFKASEDRWFFYLKHQDWSAPGPLDHALPGFCQI